MNNVMTDKSPVPQSIGLVYYTIAVVCPVLYNPACWHSHIMPCHLDPKLAVQTYATMIYSTKTHEAYCENDKQMYQNNFVDEMQNSYYS